MNCQANNRSPTLTTTGTATFGHPIDTTEPLFRTNAAIPCEEALSHASVLMDCINRLTLIGGADDDSGAVVWAAHYLGGEVKAIIDDVAASIRS